MPEGTTFGAESPLYVVIRWVQFVGLLGVVGAAAFAVCVLPRVHAGAAAPLVAQARARTARLALGATGVVALAAVLRLVAQSYAMHGPAQSFDAGLIGAMLTQTVWGRGWLLQLAAVIFAAFGFSAAARERRAGWALATLAVLALALTPALSGHAASAPRLTPLAIVADGLHVVGAGGWLGSLLFVLVVGIPAAARLTPQGVRGDAVADLVQAFSPTALAFAGLVTVTGLFAAWLHLGSVGALWESRYGTVLLVKLGALMLVIATGAYNWRRVRPALGDAAATARLRRSSTIELVVAVLVLGITAVLVATPTALDDAAMRRPSPTSDQLTGSRP
jgi:putative copper export protein